LLRTPPSSHLFPYTTLFRSKRTMLIALGTITAAILLAAPARAQWGPPPVPDLSGTWYMNGNPDQPAEVIQRPGGRALFTNEHGRSEEHTSELQSRGHLVCRL